MRKGQKKRIWTPTQKLEIVKKHLENHISVRTLEKEYGAEHGMICRWVKEYIAGGEAGLEPKKRPGNRFAAFMGQIMGEYPSCSLKYIIRKHVVAMGGMLLVLFK